MSSRRTQSTLPCLSFLPLLIFLTLLNKSLLTPPSTTFIRVTGFSHIPNTVTNTRLPHTEVNTVHNISVHPLSQLLHTLIVETNQTSLLAFPCNQHASITHPLLRLLRHTNHLQNFQYICQDADSRSLANAHSDLTSELPEFKATFRRGNFLKKPHRADVLLTGVVPITKLRGLLLKLRSAGVRYSVLHSAALPGLSYDDMDEPISRFVAEHSDAPFPFAHSLVGVSRAYGFGEDFILVYDLSYLPKIEDKVSDLTRVQVARDLLRANIRKRFTETSASDR